jgi:nucleoside phosphorylase
MVTDLTVIEAGVWTITADTPVEDIADVMGKLEWLIRRAKEVKDELESRMVEKIQAHGEFTIGMTRFYVGDKKDVKCRDAAKALDKVLEVAAGDMEQAAACLSANAFKHGTVRVMFEDAGKLELFDECFETTYTPELREGKPKLQKANLAFVK